MSMKGRSTRETRMLSPAGRASVSRSGALVQAMCALYIPVARLTMLSMRMRMMMVMKTMRRDLTRTDIDGESLVREPACTGAQTCGRTLEGRRICTARQGRWNRSSEGTALQRRFVRAHACGR
jgi:hypothetical protein